MYEASIDLDQLKILYIAGADSSHSHRWINWFLKIESNKIGWISLRDAEEINNQEDYVISPQSIFASNNLINLVFSFFRYYLKIIKWHPDIIHIHYMGLNGLLGLLMPCKIKIFTAWGSDIVFSKYPTLLKVMINRANIITVDAEHMRSRLVELGADESKIFTVNFGVETNIFTKKADSQEYRQKLFHGINETDNIVISLRNHEEIYDIETLLRSIPDILEEMPDVKFAIGGSGALTKKLKEMSSKLGIDSNVCFFGRFNHKELPSLFGQCSAYVSTSLSDAGISASTAEAMSCEVPVIISDTGENNLWIKNNENGFLFDAKDSLKLSEQMLNLLRSDSKRKIIGENGRATIIERNDYDNEMIKMNNLYKQLAKK